MRWLLIALAAGCVAAAAFAARARARVRRLDVGSVSNDWIAQHRADEPP